MKYLLIGLNELVKFWWKLDADLDTRVKFSKEWFQKQNEFTTEFESTRAIIPKQLFAFILKQLFASDSTLSLGLFNNIH